MSTSKELFYSLCDTVKLLREFEMAGQKVCMCHDNCVCQYCRARELTRNTTFSIRENKGLSNYYHKKVHCITTDKWFKTFAQAGKFYNISPASIAKCCYGEILSAGKIEGKKVFWELKEIPR